MEEEVRYERLFPKEFNERIAACPVVYVPVGSLEWHGEHMALGNDSIKMQMLCCEAALLGGGIVYPPIYYFIPGLCDGDPERYRYNPTFHGEPDVQRTLLLATLASLEKIGFRVAILTTGHTPREQIQMMRDVAGEYRGKMRVHGTCDMDFGKEIDFTSDHAGMWETSILWQAYPGLVDLTRLPRDGAAKLYNVYGKDPRTEASPALGKKAIAVIARDMAALAAKLLAENKT